MADYCEWNVIGSLLIDPARIKEASNTGLAPEDFTIEPCRAIYKKALECYAEGRPWDAGDAEQWIEGLVAEKPSQWLRELMRLSVTGANLQLHAQKVHTEGRSRRFRDAIGAAALTADGEDLAVKLIELSRDLLRTSKIDDGETYFDMSQTFCDIQHEVPQGRVDTGWPELDEVIGGIWPGNLVVIGARPGTGKSAFTQAITEYAARTYGSVAFFTLEMLSDEIFNRAMANATGYPLTDFINHIQNDQAKWDIVIPKASRLSAWPIHVYTTPLLTVSDIRRRAAMIDDLKLIVVDYLGLMRPEEPSENRYIDIGAISRQLKGLSLELKIPVIVAAQLNRHREEYEQPKMSDLRDSGEIEQNADKILFLWKLDETDPERIGVAVAKNRSGCCGSVEFRFQKSIMRFTYTPEPSEEYAF